MKSIEEMKKEMAKFPELDTAGDLLTQCRRKIGEDRPEHAVTGLAIATVLTLHRLNAIEASPEDETAAQATERVNNECINLMVRNSIIALMAGGMSLSDIEVNIPRIIDGFYVILGDFKLKETADAE